MEKNANYALVGLSTLILFVGLVIFSIWLARVAFARDYDVYDILFQGPVRGLTEGGEVHFNGIKVGEVTDISLDRTNPSRVISRVRVNSDVPIRVDSFATLEPQGITGLNYVQITAGTSTRPLLKEASPEGRVPVIQSQRSTLADLLEGGGTVLSRTVEALDRVNRVLSDENILTLGAAISDAQAVTAELRERKAIIADAQVALQNIGEAAEEARALAASTRNIVDTDGRAAMSSLSDAAAETEAAAADLRKILAGLEGPTADFATYGLPQVTRAAETLQEAAESLSRLTNEVSSNPRGVVGKGPAKEIEVNP
ncbi:MlaD family protein [Phenylobacterium sp.]|uniref:MlaD family protein n=1 Tax=Phenylobacterium sp. TaxID=1871053 RepID=UPI00273201D9|nr:MlaD family protein [Phenylobacterium sp.]MDP1618678.1 MlaD family protein [Phenylobacterium sp.]MDP1986583.1 MlaD family protein [Phenylobacterium sp.]